jgi:hypothetical protein
MFIGKELVPRLEISRSTYASSIQTIVLHSSAGNNYEYESEGGYRLFHGHIADAKKLKHPRCQL